MISSAQPYSLRCRLFGPVQYHPQQWQPTLQHIPQARISFGAGPCAVGHQQHGIDLTGHRQHIVTRQNRRQVNQHHFSGSSSSEIAARLHGFAGCAAFRRPWHRRAIDAQRQGATKAAEDRL